MTETINVAPGVGASAPDSKTEVARAISSPPGPAICYA